MKKGCIFWILISLVLMFPLKAYGEHSHGFACLGYCHSLRSGEVIPGSRAIVSDASLVDFQMCRKCHGDSQVCANKKYYGCTKKHTPYENLPFTVVDKGYDPTWPEQGNARIYIVDIGDKRTIGKIIFEFSVFTTANGKLVDKIDYYHVCSSIGCCYYPELIEHWGTPVTNWWVKGD